MSNKPMHCVIMVTYNHEKYIRTSLESVFDNDVLPDKVILFDDCSVDNTWDIVCEFKKKYEDILECHRNEKNLGLFQNINQAYNAGINSGCDIITDLAGDDYLKKGLFAELNRVVEQNKIDVKNEKFIIVTNFEELFLDGTTKLFDNYKLKNEKDLTYYRLTDKFEYREVGLSRNVLKDVKPFRCDLGVCADRIFRMDYECNCTRFYFTPFVSSVYRFSVGICSKQSKEGFSKSLYEVNKIILKKYKLSYKAKNYLRHSILRYEYELSKLDYLAKKRSFFPFVLYLRAFGVGHALNSLKNKVIGKINHENSLR